ncbi:hypothetical protein ACFW2V_02705 [Streptomyces sp. NPDC058947]|uniref:DUF6197 family protein n=1 Tax=Streptomyces sp. NPDC058947 TaxID=3346675 RepID=UPI0036AD2D6E
MTTITRAAASPPVLVDTPPLTFDERLTLAALAVDARINSTPLDLADIIRIPTETPHPATPATCPYTTPLAIVLHRAGIRLETGGWCTGALRDEQGRACLIQSIRVEATSRDQADDACALLLETIRRDYANADTIPSWNDAQTDPRLPLLYLGRAAELAHARNL